MSGYSFKADARIGDWQRQQLRDFCSTLEGEVVQLAINLGLKVYEEDLLPYERGFLEKIPSLGSMSGWVVKINRNDRPETRNFTVAHEIGHFVLHGARLANLDMIDGRMNRDTMGSADPFSYLDDRDRHMEVEANAFAAALLMPLNLFKPAYQRLKGNVEALARLFCVTEQTAVKRISELRLK